MYNVKTKRKRVTTHFNKKKNLFFQLWLSFDFNRVYVCFLLITDWTSINELVLVCLIKPPKVRHLSVFENGGCFLFMRRLKPEKPTQPFSLCHKSIN